MQLPWTESSRRLEAPCRDSCQVLLQNQTLTITKLPRQKCCSTYTTLNLRHPKPRALPSTKPVDEKVEESHACRPLCGPTSKQKKDENGTLAMAQANSGMNCCALLLLGVPHQSAHTYNALSTTPSATFSDWLIIPRASMVHCHQGGNPQRALPSTLG